MLQNSQNIVDFENSKELVEILKNSDLITDKWYNGHGCLLHKFIEVDEDDVTISAKDVVVDFDERIYNKELVINAHYFDDVFDYFDEVLHISASVYRIKNIGTYKFKIQIPDINKSPGNWIEVKSQLGTYFTRREAKIACLKRMIEIFKEK